MSILERLIDHSSHDEERAEQRPQPDDRVSDGGDEQDAPVIDIRDVLGEEEPSEHPVTTDGIVGVRGMRIRRVRLRSVAKLAAVFIALGSLVVVGSLVALWNAALALGFIDTLEETVTTSLGLETFTLVGEDLFDVVVMGVALLAVFAFVVSLALALVYNAACALFGGLAVEVGPLHRRRRVFSWRHRGFITVR